VIVDSKTSRRNAKVMEGLSIGGQFSRLTDLIRRPVYAPIKNPQAVTSIKS
jgi:hypothetical protein